MLKVFLNHFSFYRESLPVLELTVQLDWPVSEVQDLPASASLPLGLQAHATMPGFLHGS